MTTVFIVDDHTMVIEGLISLLQHEPCIEMAGYALNAEGCLGFLKKQTADVILMDINLPGTNGIDLCKTVKTTYPGIQVLALSSAYEGTFIVKMMQQGASGYLFKNAEKKEIVEAILAAAAGKIYLSFETQEIYRSTLHQQQTEPVLSKREKEVLRLIADGCSNTEIGRLLFISSDTVDSHRKNLYAKLKVTNMAQLMRMVIEHKLLD
jgi:DNA-binding NarL/FixJ family response regulator